jgi:hypothetical protein
MENNQKITYGLIGLLSLIVATMGGSMLLTPDQLDHAFICSTNQNVVIADHLSSTSKTAYWFDDLNVSKSKTCTNGLWLNLKQYAKDNNLDINVLLKNVNTVADITVAESGKSYICDQTECREKS